MEKKRIGIPQSVGTFRKEPASERGDGITLKKYVKMWMGRIMEANMRSSVSRYHRLNLPRAFYRNCKIGD
jgi:hypothetical protein